MKGSAAPALAGIAHGGGFAVAMFASMHLLFGGIVYNKKTEGDRISGAPTQACLGSVQYSHSRLVSTRLRARRRRQSACAPLLSVQYANMDPKAVAQQHSERE